MNNEQLLNSILNKSNNINIKNANIELEFFHFGLLNNFNRRKHSDLQSDSLSGVNDYNVAYDAICKYIPFFQRKNDKWSTKKQVSFIFNLFKGQVDNAIIIADIKESNQRILLDGLQRVTALHSFFSNDSMTFDLGDNNYITSEKIKNSSALSRWLHTTISINIISFDTELDAVDYYIDINEGSTHSELDILRAKEYRMTLLQKNI